MSKIQFRNAAHRDFVLENLDKCKVNDCYHRAFFYVMGISDVKAVEDKSDRGYCYKRVIGK